MTDLHQMIVDDHREVVRREPVGFEEDLVVDVRVVEAHVAANVVLPFRHAFRHEQPHHCGHAVRAFLRNLRLSRQAAPVVARRLRPCALRIAHRRQPRRGARAPVRIAAGDESVRVLAVDGDAQRLDVWIVRTADLGALTPVEPQPAQRLEDERLGSGDVALLVGVLDSQDEVAAGVARGEPCEERRPNRPEVEGAGW